MRPIGKTGHLLPFPNYCAGRLAARAFTMPQDAVDDAGICNKWNDAHAAGAGAQQRIRLENPPIEDWGGDSITRDQIILTPSITETICKRIKRHNDLTEFSRVFKNRDIVRCGSPLWLADYFAREGQSPFHFRFFSPHFLIE
jgi:hypothetical protein